MEVAPRAPLAIYNFAGHPRGSCMPLKCHARFTTRSPLVSLGFRQVVLSALVTACSNSGLSRCLLLVSATKSFLAPPNPVLRHCVNTSSSCLMVFQACFSAQCILLISEVSQYLRHHCNFGLSPEGSNTRQPAFGYRVLPLASSRATRLLYGLLLTLLRSTRPLSPLRRLKPRRVVQVFALLCVSSRVLSAGRRPSRDGTSSSCSRSS